MPQVNLKIVVPLVVITGLTIGGTVFLSQSGNRKTSPETYISKPSEKSTPQSTPEELTKEQPQEKVESELVGERLVDSFIQSYFTQELSEEAILQRSEKLKKITTQEFQNTMGIDNSSQVALRMLESYKETNVSPSGTTNVNSQTIVKSEIFKTEQSDQEFYIQVEYTVTPLGSETSSHIKNQGTVHLEEGKISELSLYQYP